MFTNFTHYNAITFSDLIAVYVLGFLHASRDHGVKYPKRWTLKKPNKPR